RVGDEGAPQWDRWFGRGGPSGGRKNPGDPAPRNGSPDALSPHCSIPMRYTTYSRYLPELADTVNLQGLLDQLADFLLQSGFAGGPYSHPFWGEFGEDESDRSMDALRQAILQALMDSGQ